MAVPVAVATGVFTDLDHVLDYLDQLVSGSRRYMLVIFHAWEYSLVGLAVLAALWYHPLFLAAVLGHLGHLIGDHLANNAHPFAYSIVYRVSRGFSYARLVGAHPSPTPTRDVPLWGRVEPWLWRLTYRLRNGQRQ